MADAKPKKPTLRQRVTARVDETRRLASTLKNEPRSFPAEVLRIVRRSLHALWRARGGGLYACGFVATFVFLEIRMFFVDLIESDGIGDFVAGQFVEKLFRYFGESIANTVQAFIWPVYVIQLNPVLGAAALLAGFLIFDRFLKSTVERWLFGEQEADS